MHLTAKHPKDPSDVIWANLGTSACSKFKRRAITLIGAFCLWASYFGLLTAVERHNTDKADSDGEDEDGGVWSEFVLVALGAGLVLFARIANSIIIVLSSFEKVLCLSPLRLAPLRR